MDPRFLILPSLHRRRMSEREREKLKSSIQSRGTNRTRPILTRPLPSLTHLIATKTNIKTRHKALNVLGLDSFSRAETTNYESRDWRSWLCRYCCSCPVRDSAGLVATTADLVPCGDEEYGDEDGHAESSRSPSFKTYSRRGCATGWFEEKSWSILDVNESSRCECSCCF